MRPALTATAISLVLAMTGCGGDRSDEPRNAAAAGQVEGGEISDAMLPLDTVRSTSPSDAGGNAGAGDEDTGKAPAESGGTATEPAPVKTSSEGPVLDKANLPQPDCPDGPGKCL